MKTEAAKTKKFSRPVKALFWLGGALVLYTVVGFLIVPAVIKSQMLKRLPPMLGRPVAVADVKVNPYAFSLAIRSFAVNETNGASFAGFTEFYARLKFSSFFQHGWAVDEIYLTHPFAQIVRAKDQKLNFDDIVATLNKPSSTPLAAPKPGGGGSTKSTLPLVTIDSLHIDNADVSVEDYVPPVPVKTKLLPIHLELHHLSTEPTALNPWSFTANTDAGESFKWDGAFSLQPLQVTGHFNIAGLDLKRYSPYLDAFASARVTDGKLTVDADYDASLGTNGPDLSLTNGNILLTSLSVKSQNPDETVLTLSSLTVKLTEASLGRKLLHLALLKTSDGSLLARQNADGTINLLSLLKQPQTNTATAATNTAAASQAPWTLMVDEIAVDRYTVALEDRKPAKPAKFNLHEISFSAKNFSTVGNPSLPVDAALNLNESGRLMVNGTVRLQPPSADLTLHLIGLDLRPIQPYVEQQAKLAVGGGLFSLSGHASYNSGKDSPTAAFQGDLGLTNFSTTDLIQFKDFVKLDGLAVNGIKFAFQPNRLDVQEVALSGLNTSVIMQTNRQLNLLAVLPAKPAAASNTPPPAAAPAAGGLDFPVTLASLVIDRASLHFSDASIEPPCQFDVQEFDGSIKGLSSDQSARASVDLRGKVDDVSTFSVTGDVNPLSKELLVNLAIECKNINLTPFTPYMEHYGGYPLQRGKLLLNLHHNIAHGELVASNHVVVAGLTLGAKNHDTNATSLPVKLGVALLKDRFGNIDLDVPLSGKLSDPNFKVMPLVWQVLDNLLGKAATAPFTLLGKLLGGGGEEMSYVDFQPGLSDLPAPEQAKLDKVANALYQRPALQVEISATSDPVSDIPVLTRLKLDEQIRSLQAAELIAAGTPPENVQSMKVEATNYSWLLKNLYLKTIGTNAAAPLATNTAPANGANALQPQTTRPPVMTQNASGSSSAGFAPGPADVLRAHPFVKGAERLVFDSKPGDVGLGADFMPAPTSAAEKSSVTATAQKSKPAVAAAVTNTVPSEVPPSVTEPTQEQMEAALLATTQITSDDLRALMQARARSVQAALDGALLKLAGKDEGQRVFLLAPAPVSPTAKGQSRATLSLE
jgi:hypothetical protein